MCCGAWRLIAAGAAMVLVTAGAAPARGDFLIVSHSFRVDEQRRQTTFNLVFNQKPDFFTTDEFGRPRNSFQYFYNSAADDCGESMGRDVVVIRGSEVRFDHDLPVRESINVSGGGPDRAEGWGPIRGSVPIESEGNELTFTMPWKTLGETDGRFCYEVFALENGSLTSDASGFVIGLPAGWEVGAIGLMGVAMLKAVKRRRRVC